MLLYNNFIGIDIGKFNFVVAIHGIKENRRLAVRYEKDDFSFLSFIALAAIKLYLC